MRRLLGMLVFLGIICILATPAKALVVPNSVISYETFHSDGYLECVEYHYKFERIATALLYQVTGYAVYGGTERPFTGTALKKGDTLKVSIIVPITTNLPWVEEFVLDLATFTGDGKWAYMDASEAGTFTVSGTACD